MKNEKLRFPVGSMIVREKLWNATDSTPHLVAAMLKRERGFNPMQNDWEFVVIDKEFKRVRRGDDAQRCASCHVSVRDADLVYKTYLEAK